MGLDSLEEASLETSGEEGGIGASALGGGGGCVDVLWRRRRHGRGARVRVLGARKSRAGYCVLRGIERASKRVHIIEDDMFTVLLYNSNGQLLGESTKQMFVPMRSLTSAR